MQVKQYSQHRYADGVKGAAFAGGIVYRENGNIKKENYRCNHKGNNRRADAAQRFFNKTWLAEFFQRAGNKINYDERRQWYAERGDKRPHKRRYKISPHTRAPT